MISCPRENIPSVSRMMKNLYVGHKFHSWTKATAVCVVSKQIAFLSSYTATACRLHSVMLLHRNALLRFYRLLPFGLLHLAARWNEQYFPKILRPIALYNTTVCILPASSWQRALSVKFSALIKTVYQECGTVNKIFWAKIILQQNTYHSEAIHPKLVSIFPSLCKLVLTFTDYANVYVIKIKHGKKTTHYKLNFTLSSIYSSIEWWYNYRCIRNLLTKLSWK